MILCNNSSFWDELCENAQVLEHRQQAEQSAQAKLSCEGSPTCCHISELIIFYHYALDVWTMNNNNLKYNFDGPH